MSNDAQMQPYVHPDQLPQVIPVFPLDGALLLPHASRPLNIFEPRYLNMLDDAMAAERIIGIVQTAIGGVRERPHLAQVGCAGRVTSFTETPDGRYLITLTGLARFRMQAELSVQTPYRQAQVDFAPFAEDLKVLPDAAGADRPRLMAVLKRYLERRGLRIDWGAVETAPVEALVNSLSMALPFDPAELQALLEADTLDGRRETLMTLLEIDGSSFDDERPQVQ
jgi:Lon protease-like protein